MMHLRRILFSDILFSLLIILLVSASIISYVRIRNLQQVTEYVNHTNTVKLKLNQLLINLKDAETGQRGFLLSKDSAFLKLFRTDIREINNNIIEIESLLDHSKLQRQNFKNIKTLVLKRIDMLNYVILLANQKERTYADLLVEGKNMMAEIRDRISEMMREEDQLLHFKAPKNDKSIQFAPFASLLFSLFALSIVVLAYFRLRSETRLRLQAEVNEKKIKQLQLETRESEKRFRLLADFIPQIIWTAKPDGYIDYYNKQWYDFTGFKESFGDTSWIPILHPDDVEICIERYYNCIKTGELYNIEYRFKDRRSGGYRWFLGNAVPIRDNKGQIIKWFGSCTDIDAQKSFSEKLEQNVRERTGELQNSQRVLEIQNSIFNHAEENAAIGSFTWNENPTTLSYSDNLFRLLGYEPREFTPDIEKHLSFVHPKDHDLIFYYKDGKPRFQQHDSQTARYLTKSGKLIYMRSTGKLIINESGDILVGTLQDVTHDKILNDTLTAQNIELERINSELDSFSYAASHDLQEPLRKIQAFINRILDKEGQGFSETVKDYFTRIISAASRMQNLIEALLIYSRAKSTEITFEPVNLNRLIEDVKTSLKDVVEESKANIIYSNLPTVNIIPIQFQQLLLNLISNGIKYSKKEQVPEIKISAELISGKELSHPEAFQDTSYWKISIADKGIGFDQQYEHRIFEIFQRLHGRAEYEGTGIGLAICKKIIQNHQGFMTATGVPGVGATFNIFLPSKN